MLTDGSHCSQDGGDSGHGIVILNEAGDEIAFYGESGGKRDCSQVVEFEAAIKGVRYAINHGAEEIVLVSDNIAVVNSKTATFRDKLHVLRELLLGEGVKVASFEIRKGSRDDVKRAHYYATVGRVGEKDKRAAQAKEALSGKETWTQSCYVCRKPFTQPASARSFSMTCQECRE